MRRGGWTWFGMVAGAGLLGLALLALGLVVDAHQGDTFDSSVIHACVTIKKGHVRIVGLTGFCDTSKETAAHWSIQGPAGEQGLQGLQGPPGVLGSFDDLAGLPCIHGGGTGVVMLLDVTGQIGKTLACGTGRYADLGLSVYDTQTKLMWEKKNGAGGGPDLGNPQDLDNVYHWCQATGIASGGCAGSITPPSWIAQVNAEGGTGYLGYDDWRVPTIGELQTIVDCSFFLCIDPIFSPTPSVASRWWSSTLANDDNAFTVQFFDGSTLGIAVSNVVRVRAVRGPLQ